MDLSNQINILVKKKLDEIRNSLIEKGVDSDIINDVFEGSKERRFLGPNIDEIEPEKMIQDWSKNTTNMILISNYTPKSHALFGDFDKTFLKFKNEYIVKQNWLNYNPNLFFGKGYVVIYKDKIRLLREALRNYGVNCREVECETFKKDLSDEKVIIDSIKKECETFKKDLSDEKVSIKKERAILKEGIKKIEEKVTLINSIKKEGADNLEKLSAIKKEEELVKEKQPKYIKNKWGNVEETATGFVYVKLPIGKDGKKVRVVLGCQDDEADESQKKYKSITPLKSGVFKEQLQKDGILFLNDELLSKIKSIDKELAQNYQLILDKLKEQDEDFAGEFGSEESEEKSDENES
jgi:hypothetical protein